MDKLIEKVVFVTVACIILAVLGMSSDRESTSVVNANPMKAGHGHFDRSQAPAFFAHNGK